MSFGKPPQGSRPIESSPQDDRRPAGLLGTIRSRLRRHVREWPKLYVQQRVRALESEK